MGPTTTYVLSAESFPKEVRSTCHGISSASGKAGALLGVAAFPVMVTTVGISAVFYLCGGILVLGFFLTWIFIDETKGKVLPENLELARIEVPYLDLGKHKETNSDESKEDEPLKKQSKAASKSKDKPHKKS